MSAASVDLPAPEVPTSAAMSAASVDLPAPEVPTSAVVVPASSVTERSSSTLAPPGYAKETWSTATSTGLVRSSGTTVATRPSASLARLTARPTAVPALCSSPTKNRALNTMTSARITMNTAALAWPGVTAPAEASHAPTPSVSSTHAAKATWPMPIKRMNQGTRSISASTAPQEVRRIRANAQRSRSKARSVGRPRTVSSNTALRRASATLTALEASGMARTTERANG